MKRKFLLFTALSMVLAGALTFTSCEKDEDKNGKEGTEEQDGKDKEDKDKEGKDDKDDKDDEGTFIKSGSVVPILVDAAWADEKAADDLIYMDLILNTNYDNLDPNGRVMDIWENTCEATEAEKGIHLVSLNGWFGGGFHSGAPLNLNFLLDEGEWRVHFNYRASAACYIQFSGEKVRFDLEPTDGEWVEVDKAIADKTSKMDNAAHYYFSFGGGGAGTELEFADVYFYLAD